MKVLLVDDEMIAIRMLQSLIPWEQLGLELMGYAQDGEDAYQMVLKEMPDIIISDIRMHNMDGLELVEKIYGISKTVKILLTSGYADFGYVKDAIRLGCSDYILKPIDENELEQALRKIIEEIRGKQDEKRLIDKSEEQIRMLELYKYMRNGNNLNKVLKYINEYLLDFTDYVVMLIQRDTTSFEEFVNTSSIELMQENYVSHILNKVIGSSCQKKFLSFDFEDDAWIFLLENTRVDEIMDICQKITTYFKSELNWNVFICFSKCGCKLQELPQLYEQVKTLQKYAFYVGEERILGYDYNCSGKEIEQLRDIGEIRETEQTKKQKLKGTSGIKYSKPVEESLKIIKKNYYKNLSLDEICDTVAVSKNYFCYLFKREIGVSVWNYLTQIRIDHAKQLLEQSDLKTYEIAFKVGYDNPSYFSKIFKKQESISPNEYRAHKSEHRDRK